MKPQLKRKTSDMTHNKSNKKHLSFLDADDEMIDAWYYILMNKNRVEPDNRLIENSPCLIPIATDGRFSINKKKVAFGYQIVAFMKFGRDLLSTVASSKHGYDLTISHLCGTLYCCTSDHLVLETKDNNDSRTSCHVCLRRIFKASGYEGIRTFFEIGGCDHEPRCLSLNIIIDDDDDIDNENIDNDNV
jgi:hypothetical protein